MNTFLFHAEEQLSGASLLFAPPDGDSAKVGGAGRSLHGFMLGRCLANTRKNPHLTYQDEIISLRKKVQIKDKPLHRLKFVNSIFSHVHIFLSHKTNVFNFFSYRFIIMIFTAVFVIINKLSV